MKILQTFYKENDELEKEELFNRKLYLNGREEIFKNVAMPITISVIFGMIISFSFFLYQNIDSKILIPFMEEVKEVLASAGLKMSEIKLVNKGEVKKLVDGVRFEVSLFLILGLISMAVFGIIFYLQLKKNYKTSIIWHKVIEYEIFLIEERISINNDYSNVFLTLKNNSNIMIYQLCDVKKMGRS
jgi:hypothetical protein